MTELGYALEESNRYLKMAVHCVSGKYIDSLNAQEQ